MLFTKLRSIRFAGVLLAVAAICILFVFPVLKGGAAGPESDASPQAIKGYGQLANVLSKCNTVNQVTEPTIKAPFVMAPSLCVNGSLANPSDPTLDRPSTQSALPGIQAGCPLTGTAVRYDAYAFNLTGCAVFPTEVTMTLCGPAGCLPVAGTDTQLFLYRNVAAGDPLTANGGLPAVFNPASPCTNARAANNNLDGGASSNPGTGNTCNQVNTANCLGACSVTTVSGFRRQLGNGRLTLVVTGTGNGDTGSYNLYVNAPAAGCSIALAPTSGNGNISGRVVTSTGRGIPNAMLTITGSEIAPITLRANGFGYYDFPNLPVGATYIVTVSSKSYTFANPTQTVNLDDSVADINFVSEQ